MKEILQGIALLAVIGFFVLVGVEMCSAPETNDCYEYSSGEMVCDDGFQEGP